MFKLEYVPSHLAHQASAWCQQHEVTEISLLPAYLQVPIHLVAELTGVMWNEMFSLQRYHTALLRLESTTLESRICDFNHLP